jgi:RNA polymerase sigma-70 factor, ECF subfamily
MSIEQTLASLHARPLVLTERTSPAAAATMPDEQRRAKLERLVRDHHTFVWRSAQRLGVPPADVEDVVQDVFVLAARKLDEVLNERGFLFQTCVFVVSHARRATRRRRVVIDDERVHAEVDGSATPEQNAAASQARATLQVILDEMPEELRVVFVLFELERLTMAEIAEMAGVPSGTVASRLRRAREIFMSRVECDGRGSR